MLVKFKLNVVKELMQHIHFTRPAKCQKNANKELYIAYMKSGHETKYSLLEVYSDRSRNKTTLNSVRSVIIFLNTGVKCSK